MRFRERPLMPFGRAGATSVVVDGWIVVIGGRGLDGRATRTVQAYNPAESRWIILNDLPDPREGAAAIAVGRRIILTGGRNAEGVTVDKVAQLTPSTVLAADVALKGAAWFYTTPMERVRYRHSANLFNGRLWAVGGVDADDTVRSSCESMNLTTGEWQTEASLPAPRFGHASVVHVGSITEALYVTGGRYLSTDQTTVYRLTPGGVWTSTTPLPVAAALHTAVVLGGEILTAGNRTPSDTSRSFDVATAVWSSMEPLPAARSGMTSAVVGTQVVHFGGEQTGGAVVATVWQGPTLAPHMPTPLYPLNYTSVAVDEPFTLRWQNAFQMVGDFQRTYTVYPHDDVTALDFGGIVQTSSRAQHTFPANTFPPGTYRWYVKITNSVGLASPTSTSEQGRFTVVDVPADFSIVAPTNGEVITANITTAEIVSDEHEAFEVRRVAVLDGEPDTATIYWASDTQYGAERTQLPISWPVNDRDEFLQARIFRDGLWSAWLSRLVSISYTAPPSPLLDIYENDEGGALIVYVINPEGDPSVIRNELWRTEYTLDQDGLLAPVVGTEVRLADALDLPPNGVHVDYRTAAGVDYAYAVGAYGENGAYVRSDYVSAPASAPLPSVHTIIYDSGHITLWDPDAPILGD